MRLDKYLVNNYPAYSRSRLQRMIGNGEVLVNGKKSKSNYILASSDRISLKSPKHQFDKLESENLSFEIVYDDMDCIVINKPPFMVVHPSANDAAAKGTVVNALLSRLSFKADVADLRPGIVHRLDKNTSGLLVVAKNETAYLQLVAQFKLRSVKKVYLALVGGVPEHCEGIIDSPIGRSLRDRKKMDLSLDGGKKAISCYKVLENFEIKRDLRVSLVEVKILTGRTHQIRVHMAAIGHPVVGDVAYGNKKVNQYFLENFSLVRQFLHSWKLSFRSPDTKKIVNLKLDLPNDLGLTIKKLKSI